MIAATLERTHSRRRFNSTGAVATYIPKRGRANPNHFDITIATTAGDVCSSNQESNFLESLLETPRTGIRNT